MNRMKKLQRLKCLIRENEGEQKGVKFGKRFRLFLDVWLVKLLLLEGEIIDTFKKYLEKILFSFLRKKDVKYYRNFLEYIFVLRRLQILDNFCLVREVLESYLLF